jgi:DNA-binding Lrp family transcriptional regulator
MPDRRTQKNKGENKMKKKELMIIASLRKNARESLTRMSKDIRVPISTIHDKLRTYNNGVIKKHTAIIDFSKLGYNTRAKVLLKVEKNQRKKVQEYLMNTKNINSLFKINNGYDFMADLVFKHIKEMEDFIENIEHKFNILNKETFYIIDDIRVEEFMSNPSLVNLVSQEG